MMFSFNYILGDVDGVPALLHVDGHTNGGGHSKITNTIGAKEVEKRIRDCLGEIARDIEKAKVIP